MSNTKKYNDGMKLLEELQQAVNEPGLYTMEEVFNNLD
ncbi:hypothetical protein JOD26_001907 [Limosilactobacillus caviae]